MQHRKSAGVFVKQLCSREGVTKRAKQIHTKRAGLMRQNRINDIRPIGD